ncbi:MAG: hypothetical protein QOD30_816 [Actinomycetota bacterium]|jgi:hypothetical protein|nr:hypothetical protein [Actinomycetota bacterium]
MPDDHGMHKRLIITAATLLLSTASSCVVDVAYASPPSGSATTCTPSFEPMTHEAILAQAQRNGIPEERAEGMWVHVNKNGDDWICQKQLQGENHYDFVDNQAVGRDQ